MLVLLFWTRISVGFIPPFYLKKRYRCASEIHSFPGGIIDLAETSELMYSHTVLGTFHCSLPAQLIHKFTYLLFCPTPRMVFECINCISALFTEVKCKLMRFPMQVHGSKNSVLCPCGWDYFTLMAEQPPKAV